VPSSLDLLAKLLHDATALVGDEWKLARTELKQRLGQLRTPLVLFGAAALATLAAALGLTTAAILALALVLPPWLAALAVSLVLALAGTLVGKAGVTRMKRLELRPRETIRSLQEGKEWLKTLS